MAYLLLNEIDGLPIKIYLRRILVVAIARFRKHYFVVMFTVAPVWIFLTLVKRFEFTLSLYLSKRIHSFIQIVAGSVEGLCRYRNIGDLPPEIFSYWADWGCYTYTRPDLFAGVQLQASQCYTKYNNTQYAIPGLIWDEKCIPFSHDNETIKKSVERTFHNPETVQRWIRCCLDAEICCKNIMMKSEAKEGECNCEII